MVLDIEKIKNQQEAAEPFSKKSILKKFIGVLKQVGTVTSKDKIFFVQNLQVMIRSGLPLDRSLKTLAEQTRNKKFKKIITDLAQGTEKGVSFSDSLKKYEEIFGHLFISMVEAGEISGKLEDVLKQIYQQIKKLHELKSKIISALTYPVIVVAAMILIGTGMMIFVVPKITSLFDQVEAELPQATKLLINVSNFIANNGFITLLAVLALIFLFVFSLRLEKTKYYYHIISLKLPIFGPIIKKINLAKFSRTLSSLIKTDISLVKSFEITAQILNNRLYRRSLLDSIENIRGGDSLTKVLNKYPHLFPPVIVQMTSAGEETGTVDEVLAELASFYEDEIDQIMKTLPSIIEPILILVLGAAVGLMAMAIIMPMYTLTQHIS